MGEQELYDLGGLDIFNPLGVLFPWIKSNLRINTPLEFTTSGIKKLVIAAALIARPKNADLLILKKGRISYNVGNDKNGDYLWTTLNGGQKVHNNSPMIERLTTRAAEHTLGRFNVEEDKDNYYISDLYNFNNSGTEYAKKRIQNGDYSFYDIIRSFSPTENSGGLSIRWTIPKSEVEKWKEERTPKKPGNARTLGNYLYNAPGGLDLSIGAF